MKNPAKTLNTQESGFRSQDSGVGNYLSLARDLDYADISKVSPLLGEVSKLLEAYSTAILTPES